MMESEKPNLETQTLIDPIIERLETYTKTNIQLVKLKTIGKSAEMASILLSKGLIVIASSMFVLILSLGCSFWLGEFFNKTSYGFFCVAAIYGLLGIGLYFLFYKRVKRFIYNHFISQLLN